MANVKEILARLREPRVREEVIRPEDLLSTGSTTLNLALTGNPNGGFFKGKYFFLVGDSISGKTFLSLTCLAEASINPNFDDYRFIYDDVEGGALMNIEQFFGKGVAKRMEPPAKSKDGQPIYSKTLEDFYFLIDDALKDPLEKPFIYVLDSMDALGSLYATKKFEEKKRAVRGGPKAKGDFGDGKAKTNSAWIRDVLSGLRDTGSILIVISQTRDNIGGGPFEPTKTRSGGRSLRFYATAELWSSRKGTMKKTVRGQEMQTGIIARVGVKKNRGTGRERVVEIPIHYSTGIDDIGSMVDYLVKWKHWKKDKSGTIMAGEFDFVGQREKLIHTIEEKGLEPKLKKLTVKVWNQIEKACEVKRKGRYS